MAVDFHFRMRGRPRRWNEQGASAACEIAEQAEPDPVEPGIHPPGQNEIDMLTRCQTTAVLFLAMAPFGALAQADRVAVGEPPREALQRARAEVASAMQLLSQADGPEQGEAVAAAMRDALDARRAVEQAVASGKALATAPDTATDRLHRAIDKVSEVERSLRQLDPPAAEVSLDAARAHLAEAASAIDAVEGRLAPFDE